MGQRTAPEVIFEVDQFNLSGNETKDCAFINKVQRLVQEHQGEFYFEYAHKNLYRFEIGGEFQNPADAEKFRAAFNRLKR